MLKHALFQCFIIFLSLFIPFQGFALQDLFLRENLTHANAGDYIVTARNKNYTILMVRECSNQSMIIEEITIPENRFSRVIHSWKSWIEQGAPHHTAWVSYLIELPIGKMQGYYSYTHKSWFKVDEENNIFTTLLNLHFTEIPIGDRKRRGSSHNGSPYWQPKMTVDGKTLSNVHFIPFRTRWSNDGTELSGKTIEIYLPEENQLYPSYFPYWMQISGTVGKSYVRIVDSGKGAHSPRGDIHKLIHK